LRKHIHLFLSIPLLGTLSCTPVVSSSPTPAPTNPQEPEPSPAVTRPSSSVQPTAQPDETPATLGNKTIIAQTTTIRGPIQDFVLNQSGEGWLIWQSFSNSQHSLQSTKIQQGKQRETVVYPLTAASSFWPKSVVNPQGDGVLAWNPLPLQTIRQSRLFSLPLSQTTAAIQPIQLGQANNLLGITVDEQNNGHMLVSQPVAIPASDTASPDDISPKPEREALYLYPISEGLVDFSKPRLITQHDNGLFITGSLDEQGNGLLISFQSDILPSYNVQQVNNLSPRNNKFS
jgi:hypothetical protein